MANGQDFYITCIEAFHIWVQVTVLDRDAHSGYIDVGIKLNVFKELILFNRTPLSYT